jgi:hypothetical protein
MQAWIDLFKANPFPCTGAVIGATAFVWGLVRLARGKDMH